MALSQLLVGTPLRFLLLFPGLAALGVMTLPQFPIERFPQASPHVVEVRVAYGNAAAEDVDQQVTAPIEEAVNGVKGVKLITSSSTPGESTVSVELGEGTDLAIALEDIERRVAGVRRSLPAGAGTPVVARVTTGAGPIMQIALASDRMVLDDLFDLASHQLAPRIQSVAGVAQVSVSGGRRAQVQVRVDPGRMQSRGVSLAQIQNSVRGWTGPSPVVSARTETEVRMTRTVSSSDQLADLGDIVLSNTPDGVVYLKDVARITQSSDPLTSRQRLNGVDTVVLRVTPQANANWLAVDTGVRDRLQSLINLYGPSGAITATVTSEQVRFARAAVGETQRGALTMLLAAALLVLLLHNLRHGLVLLTAVPIAFLTTLFVMHLLSLSLDVVSLFALVLSVGLLVDDAVAVIESIHRRVGLGETGLEAARFAMVEVGPALIGATLISMGFFLSLVLAGGEAAHLFRQFGLVAAIAATCSLVVTLTLTVALAARLPNPHFLDGDTASGARGGLSGLRGRAFEAVRETYAALLTVALQVRWLTLLVSFVAANVVLTPGFVRTEFAPREDESRFTLNVSLPPGTAIGVTDSAARTVEERLRLVPEFVGLATSVRDESAAIEVDLVEKTERALSAAEIASEVRDLGLDIPTVQTRTSIPAPLGGGSSPGNAFTIMLRGPDMDVLGSLTDEVLRTLSTTAGVDGESTQAFITVPEYRAIVDPRRAVDLGVSRQAVGNALDAAIARPSVSTFRLENGLDVDVVLQVDREEAFNAAGLGALPVQTNRGTIVRLDQVATIGGAQNLREIERYDRQRQVTIEAVAAGRPLADIFTEVLPKLQQLPMTIGYDVRIAPVSRPIDSTLAALAIPLAVAGGFAFLVLAQLWGSVLHPWAVLACAPITLAGAMLALRVSGTTLNVFSIMALALPLAFFTRHAVLLLTHITLLRQQGIPRREAVVAAGETRLRPAFISTLALGIALLPLISRAGIGAESRSPIAVAVLGGLIASGIVTLVLVPCLYTYMDDLQRAIDKAIRSLRARGKGRPHVNGSGGERLMPASGDGARDNAALTRVN